MKLYFKNIIVLSILFYYKSFIYGQDSSIFRQLNAQVWEKFEEAFRTNNVSLLNSLHTLETVRIPAESKTIITGKEYFDSQIKSFEWVKGNGYKTEMELRFIERINYSTNASEKGIFKFTVTEPDGEKRTYFGKFHILLCLVDDKWKIYMDYDSTENGTINEDSFAKAFDKRNFAPFLSKEE